MTASIRLRLRFGAQTGALTEHFTKSDATKRYARLIVDDVAFKYSDGLYRKLRNEIASTMKADIQRELNYTARMFMNGIIGVAPRNRGGKGTLNAVSPQAAGFAPSTSGISVRGLTGTWAQRSPRYLRKTGNNPWFKLHSSSPLDSLRSAKTWTAAFGGVSITVKRTATGVAEGKNLLGNTRAGTTKYGVATIRVSAMSAITPAMLPALNGGALNDFGSNPRRSGLLAMLGSDIANRLGGDATNNRVPFRPTIQPFLSFYLTRQVPNAVLRRVEQGLGGRLRDQGSVGRTR